MLFSSPIYLPGAIFLYNTNTPGVRLHVIYGVTVDAPWGHLFRIWPQLLHWQQRSYHCWSCGILGAYLGADWLAVTLSLIGVIGTSVALSL